MQDTNNTIEELVTAAAALAKAETWLSFAAKRDEKIKDKVEPLRKPIRDIEIKVFKILESVDE